MGFVYMPTKHSSVLEIFVAHDELFLGGKSGKPIRVKAGKRTCSLTERILVMKGYSNLIALYARSVRIS
jgi:hypothetical protein